MKSTIKPETQTQPKKPVINYNNKTYQSYVDNGFADNIPNDVSLIEKHLWTKVLDVVKKESKVQPTLDTIDHYHD